MIRPVFAIALLFICGSAFADPYENAHFYIGAGLGATSYDDDGEFDGLPLDDSDTSALIYGGYRIVKNVAVELHPAPEQRRHNTVRIRAEPAAHQSKDCYQACSTDRPSGYAQQFT